MNLRSGSGDIYPGAGRGFESVREGRALAWANGLPRYDRSAMAGVADFSWLGTAFALCIKVTGQISQIGWRVDMNQQESSDSNPSPNTREDDEQKAEANRAGAETSLASAAGSPYSRRAC